MPTDPPIEAVRVFVLACGQANTNWIEYYADKTAKVPTATAIFDLGKSKRSDDGDGQALDWILKRIAGFYDLTKKTTHTLAFVAFSHADGDHWGKSEDLRTAKLPANLQIKIKKVSRAGTNWSDDGIDEIQKLVTTMTSGRKTPEIISKYRTDLRQTRQPLHTFSKTCRCRVVIANSNPVTLVDTPLYHSVENDTSMVLAVEMGSKSILLTGDATWVTMHGINALYTAGVGPADCYAMTLPHHGSLSTAKNPTNANLKKDDAIRTKFAENIKPKRIVASAGHNNSYKHPQRAIMTLFETGLSQKLVAPSPKHTNIVFDGTDIAEDVREIHSWTTLGDNQNPVTADSKDTDAGVIYTLLEKDDEKGGGTMNMPTSWEDGSGLLGNDKSKKKKDPPTKRKRESGPPKTWRHNDPRNDDDEDRPRKKPKKKGPKNKERTPVPANLRQNNIEYLLTSVGTAKTRIFAAGDENDSAGVLVEED